MDQHQLNWRHLLVSYRCVFDYFFIINIVVPSPSVTVTAHNTQTVGQPLTLTCNVTTVRGISSTVDVVWRTGGSTLKRSNNVTQTLLDSSVLYIDTYTITPLSTNDDGREYECRVVMHSTPITRSLGSITMDVAGMYKETCIVKCCAAIEACTPHCEHFYPCITVLTIVSCRPPTGLYISKFSRLDLCLFKTQMQFWFSLDHTF